MERDLAPIAEVLEEITQNTSDHDPSLPSGGKTSRNVSRRASLFRRFLAFFCCSAATMSMSRRCSIQIVEPELSSPPLGGSSSPTAQVGLISVISLSDESHLSLSGETISEQDGRRIQSPASKEPDSIQAEDSTPQSYVLADELSFDETILEQDKSNLHYPDSEGSDFMQSEDSTPQRYVLANECETVSEQDRRSIQSHASEGSDSMQSEDLTSQGYVTSDELSLGDTVSENISGPGSEESDTTESEDSTSHGYVTADELSLGETVSEQDRGIIPSLAFEGYDSIQYEDSASDIYVTSDELIQDSLPQSLSSRRSIESTFPPQNSAPGTIRRDRHLNNVSVNI